MSIGPNHSFQYPRHSSQHSLSKRTACARHHSPQRASLHGNIMEYMGEHLFGGWNPMKSVYLFDRGSSLLSALEAIINHGFPVHEVISGKRVQCSKCCMIQFLGIWQKLAMSQKLRLADCFDCFVRIWQFPGFPVLGHIQYRSFLCLYDSDGPFSLWHWHGAPAKQVASICESTLMSICDAFVKKCTSYPWSSLYLGFKLFQASSSSLITAGRLS